MAAFFVAASHAPAQETARADDRVAIARLLESRARAVQDGDAAAFMETVRETDTPFARRQRDAFEALSRLPLDSYRLEARWDRYGDLAALVRPRYGAGDRVALPVVEERYRIAGGRDEIVEDLFYTFVRTEAGWRITSDDDLEDLGFQSARHLWDSGPVTVDDGARFTLLSHPCGSACATHTAVVSLADEALNRVERYWPAPRGPVAVVVPGSQEELARMLQADFDLDDFVAFAVSSVDADRAYEFVGPRIVINPPAIAGRSRSEVLMILAHELLHVATRDASGPFVPVFVEEGFAGYVGNDGAAAARAAAESLRAGGFDGRLPGDYEFMSGGADAIYQSYQESHSAIGYFVEQHGLGAFVRLYRRLGNARFRAGTTRYHVDSALRAVTGAGFRRFEREWASSIARS